MTAFPGRFQTLPESSSATPTPRSVSTCAAVTPSTLVAASLRVPRYASRIYTASIWCASAVRVHFGSLRASSAILRCRVETRSLGPMSPPSVPLQAPSSGRPLPFAGSPWEEFPDLTGTNSRPRFLASHSASLRLLRSALPPAHPLRSPSWDDSPGARTTSFAAPTPPHHGGDDEALHGSFVSGQDSRLLGQIEGFRCVCPSTWHPPLPDFAWRDIRTRMGVSANMARESEGVGRGTADHGMRMSADYVLARAGTGPPQNGTRVDRQHDGLLARAKDSPEEPHQPSKPPRGGSPAPFPWWCRLLGGAP